MQTPKSKGPSPVVLGGVIVGLLICAVLFFVSSNSNALPLNWGEVSSRARTGEFDAARIRIARFRRDWAAGDEERTRRVDDLEASVDALEAAVETGAKRLRREATRDSKGKQIRALRAANTDAPDTVEGRAARILLSRLEEIRHGVTTVFDVANATVDGESGDRGVAKSEVQQPSGSASASDASSASETAPRESAKDLNAIRALCEAGRPVDALAGIERALAAGASQSDQAALRELRGMIHEELEAAANDLVGEARSLAASGRREDRQRAVTMLEGAAERFPVPAAGGELVASEAGRLRQAISDAAASSDGEEGAAEFEIELAELEDAARLAEARGEYVAAAGLWQLIGERDADAARDASSTLPMLAALEGHLIELCRSGTLELETRDGRSLELRLEDGDRLRLADGSILPWSELKPSALAPCLRKAEPEPAVIMGAAVLAYGAGAAQVAERWLTPLVKDASTQSAASKIIAKGRGDLIVDGRGYRTVNGAFVSVREIEQREAARRVEKRIADAMRRDREQRAAVLDAILTEDPALAGPALYVLRQKLGEMISAAEGDAFYRDWQRLGEQRAELDRRRAHALELIFDRKLYFSPYKPPAVSADRYAEYRKVQDEIDERVEAVRELWEAKGRSRKPSSALAKRIERIEWIVGVLTDFGEQLPPGLDRVAWCWTLPRKGEGLTLHNFCQTEEDRKALDEVERVRAFNAELTKEIPHPEAKQLRITNDYRELLGRRPLAFNVKLLYAARGHAEEMTALGYFSHTSPTEGRRTPFQRMKNADYGQGVGENIAKHPSAASAHYGWIHSSGHHRNLLTASHEEFAVGNDGNHWVQNFGTGKEFRSHPVFQTQD